MVFTYNANGNLVGDGTRTYAYDVENRLVGTSGGASAHRGNTRIAQFSE